MLNLRVIQAEQGDCFIVEYGSETKPNYILMDGGPKKTYNNHLKKELIKIRENGGKLNRIIISHVCNDHINGLVELFLDIREQRQQNEKETIKIESLWFNQFSETIGNNNYFFKELHALSGMQFGPEKRNLINQMSFSIRNANALFNIFKSYNIPINPDSNNKVITVENLPQKLVDNNITIQVIGPNEDNIDELKTEWIAWIEKNKKKEDYENPYFKAMSDNSYQNLSSIVILIESDGKKILLTGDARGDNIISSLEEKGLLNRNGQFHVDILKLPHHGSERNVNKRFFQIIVADTYIISAQKHGKSDNPDYTTLEWLIKSVQQRGKNVDIFITNSNDAVVKVLAKYDPALYKYNIRILGQNKSSELFIL